MKHVRVGNCTLHVERVPPRGGPVIVYANSLGSDLRIWDGVVEALARHGFGALRYDLRGHGLSDLATPPCTMADHAADLAAVMDALGVARAIVCGVSVGGAIALALSALHPERVERLILCCTGAKIGTEEAWNARIAAVQQGGVAAIAEGVLQRWFSDRAYAENGPLVALSRNMLVRTPADGYAATCVTLRDSDLTEAAKAVRVPTLVIAGAHDGSTPPDFVRAFSALVPGAQFELIAQAGHLPCLQTPEELAQRIRAFAKA